MCRYRDCSVPDARGKARRKAARVKDDSAEGFDNLLPPDVIAREIVEDLDAARPAPHQPVRASGHGRRIQIWAQRHRLAEVSHCPMQLPRVLIDDPFGLQVESRRRAWQD